MQKIFQARAHAGFEIGDLLCGLILDSLCCGVEDPALVVLVRLNNTIATAAEFGAFAVRVNDVIKKTHGNTRYALVILSEEAPPNDALKFQIGFTANRLDGLLHDLFSFVIIFRRCFCLRVAIDGSHKNKSGNH